MDYHQRTFDLSLREERRLLLREASLSAEAALPSDAGYALMVTGSLSRGQVHPWSDLDLVLVPTVLRDGSDISGRHDLRSLLSDAMGLDDADIVFQDEIVDGLKRGMLASLRLPGDLPPLRDLPDMRIALARIHVSIGFSLEASSAIMDDYLRIEERMRPRVSDFDRMASSHAMDPLRRKASLWMKKLAVFADGGRSPWLDDWDDEEALDRLLMRLASPGSAPDGSAAVLDAAGAGVLRYLLVEAYDFVVRRSETDTPREEYASVYDAVAKLGRNMDAMAPGVPTHGIGPW